MEFHQPVGLQNITKKGNQHKSSCPLLTVRVTWQAVGMRRQSGIPESRIQLMHSHQIWKGLGREVTGCLAEPMDFTDRNHISFSLNFDCGKLWHNSGDTAKTALLVHEADLKPEIMAICINGGYHNLSHWEAAENATLVKPKIAIPAHDDIFPHNLQSLHMFRKSLF